jgi:Flp pilus assembly CpaE family ATPase
MLEVEKQGTEKKRLSDAILRRFDFICLDQERHVVEATIKAYETSESIVCRIGTR